MNLIVEEIVVEQTNSFGTSYLDHNDSVASFFHYSPYETAAYHRRTEELLHSRTFQREQLAESIRLYHSKWEITGAIEKQLTRLKEPNSVVVIGGQQAGLLLGPLYTFHKAISILQLAKQKEEELGIPVVPLFWIAGEDHDLLEVNHVFVSKKERHQLDKHTLTDVLFSQKTSMSQRPLPQSETREWLQAFFEQQIETEFTGELYAALNRFVEASETYVDFFAQCLHYLFSEYGLLFIDSGNHEFRKLQSEGFKTIIKHYNLIHQEVKQASYRMKSLGYTPQVQLGEDPALLFIYEKGERLLLEKRESSFQTKDGAYRYGVEELLTIADHEPWRLSNNVVTRPFIQELLFPTLAFVGGPGEVAYWALYKSYFEKLGLKMPILSPRISMTIIEPSIQRIVEKREIPLEAIFGQFDSYRAEWLRKQDSLGLEESFATVKGRIVEVYQPLIEKIGSIQEGLKNLGDQNITKILEQVEFLEKKSQAAFTSQHEATLRQFDKVEQNLYPNGKLQERMHNPFTFLNKHGKVLVEQFIQTPLQADGKHKLIYI